MAKKNESIMEMVEVEGPLVERPASETVREIKDEPVNCLRNERIIVRHIAKQTGIVTDPKHELYGGMASNAKRTFVVPILKNGGFMNVLTNQEKDFLEQAMGLETNALSVYKEKNNFWDSSNDNGINKVTLYKQDNYLDLSKPGDYIKYKILLKNKSRICPSMQELQDRPKATYEFVILSENDESKSQQRNISTTMQCYKEFGKIESNWDKLRFVVETLTGKKLAENTKLEYLQTQVNDQIQANGKLFLKVVNDPMLDTKVIIRKAVDQGVIADRGGYLYIKDGNIPMCEGGEEPTFGTAARWLCKPRNQEIKFSIEAKLDELSKNK